MYVYKQLRYICVARPQPIMLKILPIILLSSAQKLMLPIMLITTTIMPQVLLFYILINDYISIVRP